MSTQCLDIFRMSKNINYGMVAAIITIYHLEVSDIEVLQCPHLYSRLSC